MSLTNVRRNGAQETKKPENKPLNAAIAATHTKAALQLALATRGVLSANGIVIRCPICGKGSPAAPVGEKFVMFDDGGFKHWSSKGCSGDALNVLTAGGISFPDAVNYLNGKPTKERIDKPDKIPDINVETFQSSVDVEIYHGVCLYGKRCGGTEAAVEFYNQWHISPEAVKTFGAVYITDPEDFKTKIVNRFGAERLTASGLFVTTDDGNLRSYVSDNFPIVEPHQHPNGTELFLQFRASDAQYAKYLEHKAGKRPFKGSQKFLSLRGAPRHTQIGGGLPAIAQAPAGSTVHIVEGLKDAMASATLGVLAYGVPGVDYRPGSLACSVLKKHEVIVKLDADDAGKEHATKMVEYLKKADVNARLAQTEDGPVSEQLWPDHDVTDMLVARYATNGCTCKTCEEYLLKNK